MADHGHVRDEDNLQPDQIEVLEEPPKDAFLRFPNVLMWQGKLSQLLGAFTENSDKLRAILQQALTQPLDQMQVAPQPALDMSNVKNSSQLLAALDPRGENVVQQAVKALVTDTSNWIFMTTAPIHDGTVGGEFLSPRCTWQHEQMLGRTMKFTFVDIEGREIPNLKIGQLSEIRIHRRWRAVHFRGSDAVVTKELNKVYCRMIIWSLQTHPDWKDIQDANVRREPEGPADERRYYCGPFYYNSQNPYEYRSEQPKPQEEALPTPNPDHHMIDLTESDEDDQPTAKIEIEHSTTFEKAEELPARPLSEITERTEVSQREE